MMRLIGGCTTVIFTGTIHLLVLAFIFSLSEVWGTAPCLIIGVLLTIGYIWVLVKILKD